MCTVTFVPKSDGYLLAMNRDERIARGGGNPPEIHRVEGIRTIFPTDNGGGTWIAGNGHGITLALLNWNIRVLQQGRRRSRGVIIPHLLPLASSTQLNTALAMCEFFDYAPLRLIAIIPSERVAFQWNWDGRHLARTTCSWGVGHWFSSSASDNRAQELRGGVSSRASNEPNAGSVAWLRQLHRSHENGPGAFSMCVHRELVETLSYTEVSCTRETVSMVHAMGRPCRVREIHFSEIRRLSSSASKATLTWQQRNEGTDVCRT